MPTDKLTKSDSAWQAMRLMANKRLGGNSTLAIDAIEAMTAQDVQRLFHELQVHQVELEMQNDELQRVQNALQSERERYLDLYEQAPVGYCSVSEAGLILQINRTAAALLGAAQFGLGAAVAPLVGVLGNDERALALVMTVTGAIALVLLLLVRPTVPNTAHADGLLAEPA